ncbi:MAG: hypothetical protein KatS3mg090_0862 [Patescibacteria group bacterium]|nr:MAG: hypothetical protein KatS3mg090_0862 [Patescibacteria group bacterium]
MLKLKQLIVFSILVLGVIARLYNITAPLADYHSWRQVDTASTAKIFVEEGFNLMLPRYHDLSNVQSGQDNPEGYRMVEFPLYNAIFAFLYQQFNYFSIEFYGRLVSIIAYLVSGLIIYYLLSSELNYPSAIVGLTSFSFMPFMVFFTRVVLPEPTAMAFGLIAIFFSYRLYKAETKLKALIFYSLSLLFFASSILIKPTAIFYGIIMLYYFFKRYDIFVFTRPQFYLYYILSIIPFVLWRIHIAKYPEGIPASNWLITQVQTTSGVQTIFFRPSFFYWVFFKRITNLILGGLLVFYLIYGVIKNKNWLFRTFFISMLAYLFVFQGGNVQHEYYQILIFPAISIAISAGFYSFSKELKNNGLSVFVFILLFISSVYFSFVDVKGYYRIPPDLISYSRIIDIITQPNSLIVTDRNGDTTLLYLSNRKGSPVLIEDLEKLKKYNYKYIVLTDQNKKNELLQKYPDNLKEVFKSDELTILEVL